MVGSIKNITGQRVDISKGMTEGKVQSVKSDDSSVAAISGSKVDAVLTSKSREALKVMAENPSINMEAVERIKQKIKFKRNRKKKSSRRWRKYKLYKYSRFWFII